MNVTSRTRMFVVKDPDPHYTRVLPEDLVEGRSLVGLYEHLTSEDGRRLHLAAWTSRTEALSDARRRCRLRLHIRRVLRLAGLEP